MLFGQQRQDAFKSRLQLGKLSFYTFPDLRRLDFSAINFQRVVEMLNHAVIVNDVACVFACHRAVYACNGLQQGMFLERLVEVHGADNGSIPSGEQHV